MAKQKKVYLCRECGNDYPQAYGKCPACGAWNSFVEQTVFKETTSKIVDHGYVSPSDAAPVKISEVNYQSEERIDTHSTELNRVLGGGLVKGSLVLIGGEPGIGKSTLVLQVAMRMVGCKVLYISGEESVNQLKMRSERVGEMQSDCFVVSETSLEKIFVHIKNIQPELVIVDSIQTIQTEVADSTPGSVTQVRECSASLLKFAKETNIPVILIGHITKEGSIAGPKILEHIVDAVLHFEGDRHYVYRVLRANKNRFGSTDELALFEMQSSGLREVDNPSELLLNQDAEQLSGMAIAAMIEGVRPFLIEVQGLVGTSVYAVPQRSATGFDLRRMNMLLAVLEKRAGFKLPQKDVFLNIAGGLKVNDPGIDLAVMASILSSNLDLEISRDVCMTGEVGLSGEIRPVARIEQRISEAQKLGFKKIIIPEANRKQFTGRHWDIEIIGVKKAEDAFRVLFG